MPTLAAMPGLRLVLYDRTCLGLTASWRAGSWLFQKLGRFDAAYGAGSWDEGLSWLAGTHPARPVREIQYWGHGQPGRLLLNRAPLDRTALDRQHPLHSLLAAIRGRLVPDESLWWFRTCLTFGGEPGHAFARDWTRFFGAPAAGHTHVIGPLQSGLHVLRPGEVPGWPVVEGVSTRPSLLPRWIRPGAPHTITCLHQRLPRGL
jgi:hypothetical protein